MAPHSSTLAWKIPWTEEPGRLQSMGSQSRTRLSNFTSLTPYFITGEGNGNPLQYSCLENPMDRGAWQAMVHRVTESRTRLKWLSMHTRDCHTTRYSNTCTHTHTVPDRSDKRPIKGWEALACHQLNNYFSLFIDHFRVWSIYCTISALIQEIYNTHIISDQQEVGWLCSAKSYQVFNSFQADHFLIKNLNPQLNTQKNLQRRTLKCIQCNCYSCRSVHCG